MNKILISGINGFLGSNISEHLVLNGYEVWGLVRPNSDLTSIKFLEKINLIVMNSNTNLKKIFKLNNFDLVIHTAAKYDHGHPNEIKDMLEANFLFGINILEALKNSNQKNIINFSSYWQFIENKDFSYINFYSVLKYSFSNFLKYYASNLNIRKIDLILFDNYGKNDNRNKIFNQLRNYKQSEILSFGNPKQIINPVNIKDVVHAIEVCIKDFKKLSEKNQYYKVTNEKFITLKQLVEIAQKSRNIVINIEWNTYDKSVGITSIKLDYEKLPNWMPENNIEESLKDFFKRSG